jgi:hypothetical protein
MSGDTPGQLFPHLDPRQLRISALLCLTRHRIPHPLYRSLAYCGNAPDVHEIRE